MTPAGRRIAIAAIATAGVVAAVIASIRPADAQRVDPRRPSVLVVGAPGGPSPTFRGDARRTGTTKELLPSGALRIAWRKTIGLNIDQPALASADGTLAIVTATRGDVIFLDADGEEKGRVSAGASSAGGATMTSDGTVVFTTSSGDAVGTRRTSPSGGPVRGPRFVTRIGGERNPRTSPLSLDDGGVVVATASDLVVLDAEGNVRARVSLPEAPAAPLLATGDKIIAVTTTGAVYGWTPGREPVRLGSFGAPVDGGAALADANTLVAVIEGNHLVELDLARGARSSRSIAAQGLYLGPPSVRSVAGGDAGGGVLATLLAETPSRAFVVTIDGAGQETSRAPVAVLTPKTLPDGGAAPLAAGGHTGPLVDARGAVAFAAPEDGHIGVVGPEGAVDTLGELICTRTSRSSGVAGLTSLGRGAFAVTCESGAVAKIVGAEAESIRRPGSPLTPARPATPAPRLPDDEP
ncbi:MAG: hypothetical protein JWO86_3821 [Myxococcaceae bacterium]|nr:hypothetical protein [Myxococcaceae bacterium]